MAQPKPTVQSAKTVARLITGGGLILVWAIVWVNFPSKNELQAIHTVPTSIDVSRSAELDLTIPGVPHQSVKGSRGTEELPLDRAIGGEALVQDNHARQVAEMRCDAQAQELCPDSLAGDERRRCLMQRMRQLDQSCQQLVRQRMERWRAAEGYRAACAADVKRVCQTVKLGEGRILACLQQHEQDLSEACYASLPKGRLNFRN